MLQFLVLQIFIDVIGESEKEKIIIKATEKHFLVVDLNLIMAGSGCYKNLQGIYLNE